MLFWLQLRPFIDVITAASPPRLRSEYHQDKAVMSALQIPIQPRLAPKLPPGFIRLAAFSCLTSLQRLGLILLTRAGRAGDFAVRGVGVIIMPGRKGDHKVWNTGFHDSLSSVNDLFTSNQVLTDDVPIS
jgi:hypothetical protein